MHLILISGCLNNEFNVTRKCEGVNCFYYYLCRILGDRMEIYMNEGSGTINKELIDATIELEKIYLDPNNPRFTSIKWNTVADEQIPDEGIQRITRNRLEEEFSIYKLVENIRINGFLTIDRVIVKNIANYKRHY